MWIFRREINVIQKLNERWRFKILEALEYMEIELKFPSVKSILQLQTTDEKRDKSDFLYFTKQNILIR